MTYKTIATLITTASMLLAGCAKHPDSIVALSTSTFSYEHLSCQMLYNERGRIDSSLRKAIKKQKDVRGNSALGIGLGILGAFSLIDGGRSSRTKAENYRKQASTLRSEGLPITATYYDNQAEKSENSADKAIFTAFIPILAGLGFVGHASSNSQERKIAILRRNKKTVGYEINKKQCASTGIFAE